MVKKILEQSIFGTGILTESQSKLFQFLESSKPSSYDKIMDQVYNNSNIGGGTHRAFDGSHTFAGSYEKIKSSVGDVELSEFAKSHFNELVTPHGVPMFNLPHQDFFRLTNEISESLGGHFSPGELRSFALDMNSFNMGEVLGAGLGSLFLLNAFRSGDSKAISRVTAINLTIGVCTANPLQILTGMAGLSLGLYQGKICSWEFLKASTPVLAGFSAATITKTAGAGGGVGIAVGLVTSIGVGVLMAHLDKKQADKVVLELGPNPNYATVMTPWVLREEVKTLLRLQPSLKMPI